MTLEALTPFTRPSSLPSRYELGELLAQGGQGAVYQGTDTLSGAPVAIKLLAADDPSSIARVSREVAALRLLDIPGVVQLLDSGGDAGAAWIVMARVEGRPFPAGRRGWDALAPVVVKLLETLARVHELGLLHRDIKPANVLVDDAGQPTLLDFGLVRGALAGPTITRSGAVMGTPLYMAPEQVRGERADRRSDLYALGAMIREALTGQVPFHSANVALLFEARQRSDPPSIAASCPDLPPGVGAALDAMVARRPEARPTSARVALAQLRGETTSDQLPLLGSTDARDAMVEAAVQQRSAAVAGPRGSGRTRLLAEVVAALKARGVPVRRIAVSDEPLGSLSRWLGEPTPLDADPLPTMRRLLREALAPGEVLVADDWEGIDGWSRAVLHAAGAVVLATTLPAGAPPPRRSLPPVGAEAKLPVVGTLAPLTAANLVVLFGGPERLLHLPGDGAALLHRRTGGLPARVVTELQRWVDAGLAARRDQQFLVTRAALDRISGGFAGPAIADLAEDALPVELDELLAWVQLGGPACTLGRLASARKVPAWRLDLELRQLEVLGAVARADGIIEPTRPASALLSWGSDSRMAAHEALANALPPGTAGRTYHLVAIGDTRAAVDDACALAARLLGDAQLSEARAALEEAGRLALSAGVPAGPLWKQLAALALQDGTRPALAAAVDLLTRSDTDPALGEIMAAALALVSGERTEAVRRVEAVLPGEDTDVERLRWEVRLNVARGGPLDALRPEVEAACRWATEAGTDAALAARADWRSSWLYQSNSIEEAADEAESGASLPQPLGGKMRLMLRSLSCLLLVGQPDRALAVAEELGRLAKARRLPRMEAYAEWGRRAVANQTRQATGVDEQLVEAAAELGAPELAGIIWVNEAVIAWWLGERARGAALAADAERAFTGVGAQASAVWARAVRLACAPDPAEALACAEAVVATGRPDFILESLGLLRLTGGLTGDWADVVRKAAAASRPTSYPEARRAALSPAEVLRAFDMFGLALPT